MINGLLEKIRIPVAPALIGLIAIAAGCGSKERAAEDTVSTDTLAIAEDMPDVTAGVTLDSLGIDAVRIGMDIANLPPAMEDVYDSIASESGYESNLHTFFMRGNPRFTVYEFQPGKLDMIAIESRDVYVISESADTLRIGDDFTRVMNLPGVSASWESTDDEGMWCWQWRGLWFQPDQSCLGEKVVNKLYNPSSAPTITDFESGETIGYIGTGLPW